MKNRTFLLALMGVASFVAGPEASGSAAKIERTAGRNVVKNTNCDAPK